MTDPLPSGTDQKHVLYDELVTDCIAATNAGAYVIEYLNTGQGNPREFFPEFYRTFNAAYQLSRYLREIKNMNPSLTTEINGWWIFKSRKNQRQEYRQWMRRGVELFSLYYELLLDKGVIVLIR